jgi:hypothetical protein
MLGLGLVVGAVLHGNASAQADTSRARKDTTRRDTSVVRVPGRPTADSTLRDSLAKRDTLHKRAVPRDTLRAPFTRASIPVPIEIGQTLIYDKAALFATGAITLQDLLDRIPEISGLRSGWIAAPMISSFMGDVRRVRVFFDGVEFDSIDPRTGRQLDLTEVPLWTLEELRIERGATEVRVYTRTWRVDRTTPYTRTDINTGDQQTNMYRGFFGRRWGSGEGIQVAAQQYGTTPPFRSDPSSDQLTLLGRAGWAKGGFSFDAFAVRQNRNRGTIIPHQFRFLPYDPADSIPGLQSSRTDAYLRAGWGDPEHGPWLQAIASALSYSISHKSTNAFGATTATTIPDTDRFEAQYVLTGGFTLGIVRLEAAERLRTIQHPPTEFLSILRPDTSARHRIQLSTPSVRAELVTGPLALSAFAEARGPDSLARVEATARLTPLPFVSLLAAAGRSTYTHGSDSSNTANFLRGEAGLRLLNLWFIGGIVRRDSLLLPAPLVFGQHFIPAVSPAATGFTAAIRGTLYEALHADVSGIRWNDSAGFYRPRYQTRSEVYLSTNWLSRFPSGNFGVLASISHEYRSRTYFPVAASSGTSVLYVPDAKVYGFRIEFRILSAILSYQFRNLVGYPYQIVPGLLMPRQTQFYGVRWEFWN